MARPGSPRAGEGPAAATPGAAAPRARGTGARPPSRFESRRLEAEEDDLLAEEAAEARDARTVLLDDPTRRIVAWNRSPDVGFDASVNPYRGCEHGCIYCYARPTHEYLGYSAGLDFETRILVKRRAPELLRRELASPRWEPRVLALSGVTDPYQPAERRLELTRGLLGVLAEFRNPVAIITKNALVTRDRDLLAELAAHGAAAVNVSVTTLDPELQRAMEPRTSAPGKRLRAVERLAEAGVPVGVMVAPVVPGLTDHEIPRIVRAAADAGARFASKILLRLPHGVSELFEEWLGRRFPERKEKVLSRIRAMRGGRTNDPRFGSRMRGEGLFAEQSDALFRLACRRAGLGERPALRTDAFRRPAGAGPDRQLALFG